MRHQDRVVLCGVQRAVGLVSDRHILDCGSAREPLFCIEGIGHYVHRLDRVQRRRVHRISPVVIGRAGSVDASIVPPSACPVHSKTSGARRIRRKRSPDGRRRDTGHDHGERHLVVAA